MMNLKYYKLYDDVLDPVFATKDSACFDVHAYFGNTNSRLIRVYDKNNNEMQYLAGIIDPNEEICLNLSPGDRALIPTGIIFDIPKGYSIRVHARSSIALKQGLNLANSEGVIDSDYVLETFIMIHNFSDKIVTIYNKSRLAQLELIKLEAYTLERTNSKPSLDGITRSGGFGSTGV